MPDRRFFYNTPGFSYICADVWIRERDASLWLDVPAHMIALGFSPDDRRARQSFARKALRELREMGLADGLLVARVDGMGGR